MYRDGRDRFAGFSARGHADFAEYGQDIVCAAVSAILQATRLGLEHYAAGDIEAAQDVGAMRLIVREGGRDAESVAAIGTTARLAIVHIARRYAGHIALSDETLAPQAKREASIRVSNVAHDEGE